ncbi:hypothetical protein QYE76_014937 [Lolium multiflorum]|uniref:Ubiquitin-like protease family profile domain-containing protein n=1 Tax=Lolium multiflorum TaxID=4521 RepID=A0AAD8X796_LOLMU|nr:hypothetical protein QYE76_014937 [Lolium multiflorum]
MEMEERGGARRPGDRGRRSPCEGAVQEVHGRRWPEGIQDTCRGVVGRGRSQCQVQADKANAARRGIGDAINIRLEEASSCRLKEDLRKLFTPLTNEDETLVDSSLYGSGHSKKILVLHEPSNIEITREELGCLRPRGWLNDEVINLYLELLKERAKREPTRFLKCHFFNTFFYKKVIWSAFFAFYIWNS